MSTLCVQLGQCGNQIGYKFHEYLYEEILNTKGDLRQSIIECFYDHDSISEQQSLPSRRRILSPRSILIDMEKKVIDGCIMNSQNHGMRQNDAAPSFIPPWSFNRKNCYNAQCGSGNNWAFGYNQHGPAHREKILDIIYSEAEKMDRMSSLVLFQSLAGGTGSGLGTYTSQLLRDSFPSAPILSVAILPFITGEVTVQSYNASLSLSLLSRTVDAILVLENDKLVHAANTIQESLPSTKSKASHFSHSSLSQTKKRSAFTSMNEFAAEHILNTLLPICSPCGASLGGFIPSVPSLIQTLTAHPAYPILTCRTAPWTPKSLQAFDEERWTAVTNRIGRIFRRRAVVDASGGSSSGSSVNNFRRRMAANIGSQYSRFDASHLSAAPSSNKAIAALQYLRGNEAEAAILNSSSREPIESLSESDFVGWGVERLTLGCVEGHCVRGRDKTVSLVSNCQTPLGSLKALGERTGNLLNKGAYVHQMEKFGIGAACLEDAWCDVAQIVENYEGLGTAEQIRNG